MRAKLLDSGSILLEIPREHPKYAALAKYLQTQAPSPEGQPDAAAQQALASVSQPKGAGDGDQPDEAAQAALANVQ